GIQANGSLMLLLGYLLKNDWQWRKANIFVKLVIKNPHALETTQTNLNNLIEKLNIDVIPQVIVSEETSFEKILYQYSDKADLIFLGLAEPQEDFDQYYYQWQQKTKNLPSVAFMMAANDFPFEEVLQKD
ncbi:MAG: Na-K-Cl cotransporter, partial [Cyanobacteria bacterium J149]